MGRRKTALQIKTDNELSNLTTPRLLALYKRARAVSQSAQRDIALHKPLTMSNRDFIKLCDYTDRIKAMLDRSEHVDA